MSYISDFESVQKRIKKKTDNSDILKSFNLNAHIDKRMNIVYWAKSATCMLSYYL